jgi:hypothetical protein
LTGLFGTIFAVTEKSPFEQVNRTSGFGASNLPRTPFFQAQLRRALVRAH